MRIPGLAGAGRAVARGGVCAARVDCECWARMPGANSWARRRGSARSRAYFAHCPAEGQTRPTPLILRYEADDFDCLHQDLCGALVFPFQLTVLLSEPGHDFEGGALMLVEQRPRMQSRGKVVPLR
jgi:uncharacterized protein